MGDTWASDQAIHAGQQVDPTTGARALPIYSTTSLRLPRHRPRGCAVRPGRERQHLHLHRANPTQAVVEERIAALEGGVRAARERAARPPRPSRSSSLAEVGDHIVSSRASTAAPTTCSTTPAQAGHRGLVRRTPRRPRAVARRGAPQHEGVLRRDDLGTRRTTSSTSRASPRSRTRTGSRFHRRQHGGDAVPDPPRSRAPTSSCTGDEVPRRPRHRDRGVIVDSGNFDWGADPEKFPRTTPARTRATTAWSTPRTRGAFGNLAFIHQGPRAAAARPRAAGGAVQRILADHRRASRPCRCASSATSQNAQKVAEWPRRATRSSR